METKEIKTSPIAITFSLLPPTQWKKKMLETMAEEFILLYNITAKRLKSFVNYKKTSARAALSNLRKGLDITNLHSQIAQEAIEYARSNYQSVMTNRKKYEDKLNSKIQRLQKQRDSSKKPSKIKNIQKKIDKWERRLKEEPSLPELNSKIIRIHNQAWKFDNKHNTIVIVTKGLWDNDKKEYVKLVLPIKSGEWVKDIINNHKKFGAGQINLKDNTFTTTIDVPIKEQLKYKPETFVGIDRGVNNIAVFVALNKDNEFIKSKFFNGDEVRHIRSEYNGYRKEVSKVGRLDLIKKSKYQESNWMEYVNHNISRKIIDEIVDNKFKNTIILLEKLNNFAPHLKWNYYQLQQMIEYKARMSGILVDYVNPAYTSQSCPKCKYVDKKNRDGIKFKCVQCGYQNNADFVGAWNIATKYHLG